MREGQLKALQGEYVQSKQKKETVLHVLWREIMNEYRMENFNQVLDHVARYRDPDDETWLAANGARVANLQLNCRKMAALGSIWAPEFNVESPQPQNEPIATVLGHWMTHLQETVEWTPKTRRLMLDAVLTGTGIVKLGLSSEYVYGETAWSGKLPGKIRGGNSAGTDQNKIPGYEGELPYGVSTEFTDFSIQEGYPALIPVRPTDVFFNLGARVKEEVRRIYHRRWRPLKDVLHDVRYAAKARKEVFESALWDMRGPRDYDWSRGNEQEIAWVCVVECLDLASRQFCVFVEGAMQPLRDWSVFPLPVANPYYFLTLIDDPEWIWGIPYALTILGQCKGINDLRAMIMDQIGRDGKKIIAYDSRMDQDDVKRVQRGRDGEWAPIDGLNEMEKDPFQVLELGGANPETMKLANIFELDLARLSGLTDQTRLAPSAGDETATAASMRQQAQNLTTEDFVKRNEEFQAGVAKGMLKIALATWPASRMIKVVGPSPELYFWVPVERERVLADFTITVVAGSSQKQDKPTQRKQWLELLPRIAELSQQAQLQQQAEMQGMSSIVNWTEVLRETLNLFDPTLAGRILNATSLPSLLLRLMKQHSIYPVEVSPELAQQAMMLNSQRLYAPGDPRLGQAALEGMGVVGEGTPHPGSPHPNPLPGGEGTGGSFEVRNGVAMPGRVQAGMMPGELGGNVSGRALSEAMG